MSRHATRIVGICMVDEILPIDVDSSGSHGLYTRGCSCANNYIVCCREILLLMARIGIVVLAFMKLYLNICVQR